MQKFKSENYSNVGGINSKVSQYANGPMEFRDLRNVDFSAPGALTQRSGTSLYITGVLLPGRITGLYEFDRLSGPSYLILALDTGSIYRVTQGGAYTLFNNALGTGLFDFTTFVDRLFYCNGASFWKYDGTNNYLYSLPTGSTATATDTGVGTFTGTYQYAYGFVNERGYYGPPGPAVTITINNVVRVELTSFPAVPSNYGVTGIAIYRSSNGGSDLFKIGEIPSSAIAAGFTDAAFDLSTFPAPPYVYMTLAPRYIEIFNNSLVTAGFSQALSTFFASDVGEPEGNRPENFFEVRTNDGDRIYALKAYGGNLFVFKSRSYHVVSGDVPEEYSIKEVSAEFGCVSNRAVLVFEDFMLFLDPKGVAQFNGANTQIISTKVEPYFRRMNLQAAYDNAIALNYRQANQAWFHFPIDGATLNNFTVVYDYYVNQWTTFDNFQMSSANIIKRGLDFPTVFYGGYTGAVNYFDTSLLTDSGVAFTGVITTRNLEDLGNSVQKVWRRLYLDADPTNGGVVECRFYPDYSSGASLIRSITLGAFQARIDYGISSKSIKIEMRFSSNASPTKVKINGFSVDYREQRRV